MICSVDTNTTVLMMLMVMMKSVTQSTHHNKVYPFDVAAVEIWKFLAYSRLAPARILPSL